MKIRQKLLLTTIGLLAILLISNPIKVNAALQANGNTGATKNVATWLLQTRQMETTGGTLGLEDTIDTSTLLSTASESNKLDIHMQKNTEYGAMAILSASAYGNPNPIANGGTTTGNKSGIYIYLNREWVSAAAGAISANVDTRYKNSYAGSYVAKSGDAVSETAGWHSSGASTWLSYYVNEAVLIRAYSGSIFSYYGYYSTGTNGHAGYNKAWRSRACVVIGNGI